MIDNLLKRSSVRNFRDGEKMSEDHLEIIKKLINSTPTSTNAHQFSAIISTDKKLMELIADVNFGQDHIKKSLVLIIFIADRYRMKQFQKIENIKIVNEDYQYHEYIRTIMDASIASSFTVAGLNDLGYGVSYIGGFPTVGKKMEEILDLPKETLPILGLAVGLPLRKDKSKPKLNKVFEEKYNKTKVKEDLIEYNEETSKFYSLYQGMTHFDLLHKQNDSETFMYKNFEAAGKYLKQKSKEIFEDK